jgi:DNA ligase-1
LSSDWHNASPARKGSQSPAMSTTPRKKRKLNTQIGSSPSQGTRSIDFFFGKTRQTSSATNNHAAIDEERSSPAAPPADDTTRDTQLMTDEELARKLQAEWDQEEATARMSAEEPVHEDTRLPGEGATHGKVSTESPAVVADLPERKITPLPLAQKTTLSLQSATAEEDTISYTIPFEQTPLTFDPQDYIPALQAQWQKSSNNSTYALLTHCFMLVNATTSRIKIVDTLTNLLRVLIEADPSSLVPAVWLATNSISPPYIDVELGLGGSAISKALKRVCGLDNSSLRTLYNKHGDAGDVAFEAKKRQSLTLRKPNPLTIKFVFDSLTKIANAKGTGSVEVKQRIVERLVQDARGAEESRYIVRTLVQHLRIGAVKTTMLIALSRAFLLSRPPGATFEVRQRTDLAKLSKQELTDVYRPGEELVKASFARRPNYNDLIPALTELGVLVPEEFLARCGLAMHIPLRPMLGGITRDLNEMLLRLEGREFACEFKYDGQRAQVHCDAAGKVTIFSRHLEVMTAKYPDLVALVPRIRGDGVRSFILEGEVVAVDKVTGDLQPFQILSNRARKDVVVHEVKVDVCLFAFDLMYLNGEELLDRSFRERRSLLRSLFVEIPNHFTWVKSIDATSDDVDAISAFFKSATDTKCEGIMVKVLDNPREVEEANITAITKPSSRRKALPSTYTPDKRLDSWLKVKKDYNNAQTDTLDLVPVGGWHGQGRKNKWWSPVLLACRNEEDGTLEVVTKCMSGFTDAFYKEMRAKYDPDQMASDDEDDDDDEVDEENENNDDNSNNNEHDPSKPSGPKKSNVVSRPSYITYSGPEPQVWFNPQEVWEIVFADITLSPTYSAARGLVSDERGLSLRFPRFLKIREDKGVDEASTNHVLAELYRKQGERPSATVKEQSEDEGEGG